MPFCANEIELYQIQKRILFSPTAKSRQNILSVTLWLVVLKKFRDSPLSGGNLAFLRTDLKIKNYCYLPTMLACKNIVKLVLHVQLTQNEIFGPIISSWIGIDCLGY
jgi:hypothetical protein